MTRVMTDLRDGARMLLRSPGFAAVAVLMLALGIGVNTTVFSWLNAVLLSPLPGAREPHRIVQVGTTFKGNIDTSFSYVDYQQLRSLDGFAGMAARSERPLTLAVPLGTAPDGTRQTTPPERVWCELVSDNFFSLLGVQPVGGTDVSAKRGPRSRRCARHRHQRRDLGALLRTRPRGRRPCGARQRHARSP